MRYLKSSPSRSGDSEEVHEFKNRSIDTFPNTLYLILLFYVSAPRCLYSLGLYNPFLTQMLIKGFSDHNDVVDVYETRLPRQVS